MQAAEQASHAAQARVSDEHTQAAAAKGEGTRTVRQTADELAQLAATERQQRRTS